MHVNQVKEAIDALGSSNADAAQHANSWLMEFERSPAAWEVSHQLLLEQKGSNKRFFGANILYNKIRRDFFQLSGSSADLKNMVITHLLNLASEVPVDYSVCKRMCLSLAVLAVQLNESGIVDNILVRLNPILEKCPQVVLDLLAVLPEECFNDHVDVEEDRRYEFAHELKGSVPQVFSFLASFTSASQSNLAAQTQALKCLERWIDTIDISQSLLANHPMMTFTLVALRQEDLFDEAVEVLVTIFRRYGGMRCFHDDMILPRTVLPHVLALSEVWRDNCDGPSRDEDVCRGIARLFAELAEGYVMIIVNPQINFHQPDIMQQLVACADFNGEFDITRIPLRAFYEVSLAMHETSQEEHHQLMNLLGGYFHQLLAVTLRQMRSSNAVLSGQTRMTSEEECIRGEWHETLVDVVDIIGGDVALQQVCAVLQRELSSQDAWPAVEACLSAIAVISAFVNVDDPVISQLLAFLPSLPNHLPGLVVSRNKLLGGRLCYALNSNSQLLKTTFEMVATSLNSPVTCASASAALCTIFKSCAQSTSVCDVTGLHGHICEMRQRDLLPLDCDVKLLEGYAHLTSRLDREKCEQMFSTVLSPIATSLTANLQKLASSRVVLADVERFTIYMRDIHIPDLVMSAFITLWPLMQTVMQVLASESACEKVCRFYKYVIRNVNQVFAPHLPNMAQHLTQQFSAQFMSCFVYVASVCCGVFATNTACHETLTSMFNNITVTFFNKCTDYSAFEHVPDVVEEFYYCASKFASLFPNIFVSSPHVTVIVQAGVMGLCLKHREAQKGILSFFEKYIEICSSNKCDTAHQSQASSMLISLLPSLVSTLFSCLSGQLPVYALDESHGSISSVLWKIKQTNTPNIEDCFAQAISTLSSNNQEMARKLKIPRSLTEASRHRDFADILDAFERKCRRLRTAAAN